MVKNYKCEDIYEKLLPCGYKCTDKCINCQERSVRLRVTNRNCHIIERDYGKCKYICNKILFCEHKCGRYCHKGACKNECMMFCKHTSCNLVCSEPCVVCVKKYT